jgi:hypothetical protein
MLRANRWMSLMGAAVALAACGKSARSVEEAAGGGGADAGGSSPSGGSFSGGVSTGGLSGNATGGNATGGNAAGGAAGSDAGGCVVVRRLGCCTDPFAVPAAELAGDPCLVAFDTNVVDGTRLRECAGLPPPGCVPEPCTQPAAPSRSARRDESGACRIVDECETNADCTFATQCCSCCTCSEPMPKSRAANERCIVANDPSIETEPLDCPICPGVCLGCRHDGELACAITPSGFRRCQWGPALAADVCTEERPCVGDFEGANCVGPDDDVCGGPPPPPDECAGDSDCANAGSAMICEPSGHCGMRRCVEGCTSDDDCTQATACAPDHRCAPVPCSTSAECGPNFECAGDGSCARHRCVSSANCEGYCVNGLCHDAPGQCRFPLP